MSFVDFVEELTQEAYTQETPEERGPREPVSQKLHEMKYRMKGEGFRDAMNRIASALSDNDSHFKEFREILLDMRFLPAGRIQSAIGSSRRVTAFNCFLSGPLEDNLVAGLDNGSFFKEGGIMARATEAAQTMRLGGGIGYDFSTLRPRGDRIKSMDTSASGPVSFMDIFDSVCRTIASAGHRRGAQMAVLRVDHPDIEEFIYSKQNTNQLNGFNISVGITDKFMKAVIEGKSFDLQWGGQIYKTVDAVTLWEQIMRSTWDHGEPGVLFMDTINRLNNLNYCETISATNPCWTGDTKVWTVNGPRSFLELATEGKDVQVLSEKDNGEFCIRWMRDPRMTRKNAKLIEICLRNHKGKITRHRCTPDHKIFLLGGEICRAKDLTAGMSVASVYRYKANSRGYRKLLNKATKPSGIMEHWINVEALTGEHPVYPTEHVHHIDGVRWNNKPNNLEIVDGDEHNRNSKLGNKHAGEGINNYNWNSEVETNEIVYLRDERKLTWENIASHFGVSRGLVQHRYYKIKDPSYSSAGQFGRRSRLDNHTITSVRILDYEEPVYCGTVDETHKFFIHCNDNDGILSANCAEQPLPPYGACLLGSFNLTAYISLEEAYEDEEGFMVGYSFDWEQFIKDIPPVIRAMDNVTDATIYPLKEQEIEAKNKRRMGIGITGLANAGEALGYPYGSQTFIEFEGKILKALLEASYTTSALLAKEKGQFPWYDERYLNGEFIKRLEPETLALIKKFGMRNSHLTSIAPTGTISLCADNVSSGLEPVFDYKIERTILDFTGPKHYTVRDYGYNSFGIAGKRANECSADEHMGVLIEAYKYVDSAVSKTCNVDPEMPWEDFKAIYQKAWENDCKGCTTFNIGGKRMGIMKGVGEKEEPADGEACHFDPETGGKTCE